MPLRQSSDSSTRRSVIFFWFAKGNITGFGRLNGTSSAICQTKTLQFMERADLELMAACGRDKA